MPIMISITTVQSTASGAIVKEVVAQKRESTAGLREHELALAPHRGDSPDPRLVELVRLLARRAAQEWYKHVAERHRSKRS
jgi:hypothetical protein